MLVILRENVENLGRIGDVVKVKEGYARNFLIPRNLVILADEKNVTAIEHQRKTLEKKRQATIATAQELAQKVSEYSCTIQRKVKDNDRLYGSVTSHDVSEALKKGGFPIEKSMVQLDAPIKSLGVHTVSVRLESDVAATVKVWVVKEEG